MAYIPNLKGYVADVPEFHFTRIDGKKFTYTELTAANVTPQVNFTEVNAGWSLYPVAYLPAAQTLEAQLTSGQFDSSLFALANGEDFAADSTYKLPVCETLPVQSSIVTLSTQETPVTGSVKINGMTVTTGTPTSGTYKVETSGTTTTVTFYESDFANGDLVEIHYDLTKSDAISMGVSNDKAAIGEAVLIWPEHKWAS